MTEGAPCPNPRKIAHPSEAAARAHLDSLRRKDGADYCRPYRCRCGAWHVGHDRKLLDRAIATAVAAGSRNAARARRKRGRR